MISFQSNYNSILSYLPADNPIWPYKKERKYSVYIGYNPKIKRTGYEYKISDLTVDTIEAAAKAILKLLNADANLIPIFHKNNLTSLIGQNQYLIINGRAVCLSNQSALNLHIPDHLLDHFFSGKLIEKPYKCFKNYLMDLESVEFWRQKEQECPCGKHLIHPEKILVQNEQELGYIQRFISGFEEMGNGQVKETEPIKELEIIDSQLHQPEVTDTPPTDSKTPEKINQKEEFSLQCLVA